ncbi:MAG: bifunctional proline dehydrogenase/L-glutamate gamma-semialdehyde dehydrogenase PutA [Gammaproteobacteria bacterium]|nr:bifunctional proline dehydrogenase/L-glutamate gamma-semialdehyde dehydrogenase PutA [Gammaproteobacteria bacterium]
MLFQDKSFLQQTELRAAMTRAYRTDETACLEHLISTLSFSSASLEAIQDTARELVKKVRTARLGKSGLDAFLVQYDLGSQEGIALMCLAEALLRIPDNATRDKLIKDKIATANWAVHSGQSPSLFVNAATWGLMLTGKVLKPAEMSASKLNASLKRFIERSSEPVIRNAVLQAMKILGKQFVMGRTIEEAISRAQEAEKQGYRFSYDMLGEAARTMVDAERYFQSYKMAIEKIGEASHDLGVIKGPSISIKLSALYPRYEFSHRQAVLAYLVPKVVELAQAAKRVNIAMTIDAEETERLDLSLDIMERVFADPTLSDWQGAGLAVQAYQKRAPYLLDCLADFARKQKRRLNVRLVKGAYWDAEIKQSQVMGLEGYPVFTRKGATDVSYLACAKKMLSATDAFYPQFATHNAYSVAAILEMAGEYRDFEFQCLHGMGYTLYDQVIGEKHLNIPCRVYAPVGTHEDLLAYLVRRLLENGANTSFVNRIIDEDAPISDIIADPVAKIRALEIKPHPGIPLPRDIYQPDRKNSMGIDLSNYEQVSALAQGLELAAAKTYICAPLIAGKTYQDTSKQTPVYSPLDQNKVIGYLTHASTDLVETVLSQATEAAAAWAAVPVEDRAHLLEKAADLLEEKRVLFMALAQIEGGKTVSDAIAEVREAADFCRYYAAQAREIFSPLKLKSPTGETNTLRLCSRGPLLCISPWNFPLAIFLGQITAALATGNPVIAKPAEQTSLIAYEAVKVLHEAGIPESVLQLFPARGSMIGQYLVPDERIKGVIFTGSTETAQLINQTLAQRHGSIVPLIAETGGQNVMIVDSSALPEQVVSDVMVSAFGSAGQRCSALRVLYLQEDIADKTITMLKGAMQELNLGDPRFLNTDVGPVIDRAAWNTLDAHVKEMLTEATLIYQMSLPKEGGQGVYFGPCAFEIDSIKRLKREVFGPVLHVVRYAAEDLEKVMDEVNAVGYGLTLGIHSRIEETIQLIASCMRVGNTYVNRSMTGAVVGVQPFGGEGLSGTGPKAGGPHYLPRLCTERTLTINTTASGGNASLLSLDE